VLFLFGGMELLLMGEEAGNEWLPSALAGIGQAPFLSLTSRETRARSKMCLTKSGYVLYVRGDRAWQQHGHNQSTAAASVRRASCAETLSNVDHDLQLCIARLNQYPRAFQLHASKRYSSSILNLWRGVRDNITSWCHGWSALRQWLGT